jgi:hypothetical protein
LTQPYVHHKIIKYELTLPTGRHKQVVFIIYLTVENKPFAKHPRNSNYHTNRGQYMGDRDFRKIQEKEPSDLEFI